MKIQLAWSLGVLAIGALTLGACDGGSDALGPGAAGTSATGAAGTTATVTGSAGTTASTTGEAGTSGPGAAGTTGSGGGGTSATGAAGTTVVVTTGAAGTNAATAGTGGGGAGTTGGAGTGASGADLRHGMSSGCGKAPPAGDASGKFTKHDIMVTGVDPAFIAAHPANVGGYTWTKRNYSVRLPANYDPSMGYPVHLGGGGCGNTDGNSGGGGGFTVPGGAIEIGLSYVFGDGQGACFQDGYANTPEVPFFDSVMKEIDANYCYDKAKVFIGGYSSGAWEAYTLGFARGNVIRGIATAAGGLRMARPPSPNVPFAAILLTGAGDTTNPITGPTGSGLARDLVLQINKCTGTATTNYPMMAGCVQYTGCPAAYPVIWCTPGGGHTDGGGAYKPAISAFWGGLSAPTP